MKVHEIFHIIFPQNDIKKMIIYNQGKSNVIAFPFFNNVIFSVLSRMY